MLNRGSIVPEQNLHLTKNHLLRQLLQRRIKALESDKKVLRTQIEELEQHLVQSAKRNSNNALGASTTDKIQQAIDQSMQSVRVLSEETQEEADFTLKMVLHQQEKLLTQLVPLQQEGEQLSQKLVDAMEGIRTLEEQLKNSHALLVEDVMLRQEKLTQELKNLYDQNGYLRADQPTSKQIIADVQQRAQAEVVRIEAEAQQVRGRMVTQIDTLTHQSQKLQKAMDHVMRHVEGINRSTEAELERAVIIEEAVPERALANTNGPSASSDNLVDTAAIRLASLSEKAYQTAAHEFKALLPPIPVEDEATSNPTSGSRTLHDTAAMRLKAIDPHVVAQEEINTSQTGKKIAKNASVLMASQLSTWLLTLLLMLFLPRYLGAEAVGQLHLGNSIWAIVAIVISFGMDRLLIKDIARRPSETSHLFGTTVVLRTFLYFLGFGAIALYLYLLDYPAITIQVVYVIGLSQLIWQIVEACQAALQGLEQMQYMSLANIVGKAVNTVVSIALLMFGFHVLAIAAVSLLSALINLVIQLRYLNRLHPIRLRFSISDGISMLKAGSPYLLTRLSLVIYQQVDIIIISLLVNETTIGWYGVADQLFGTFLFIPTVFMTAIFPALSRMYATASNELSTVMSKSFDTLLLLSVPIGLGLLVVADPLVVLLFGKAFAPSGPVLAVMGIVLILTYQNILLGQFLVSTDRQNHWTVVMAVAAIATVPLDWILIPWCAQTFGNGAIGGAMVFVITELCMMVAGLRLLPEGSLGWRNFWLGVRVLLAGAAMMAATWWIRDFIGVSTLDGQTSEIALSLALQILTGAVTYIIAGLLLQIVSKEDRAVLTGFASSVLGKLRPQSVTT